MDNTKDWDGMTMAGTFEREVAGTVYIVSDMDDEGTSNGIWRVFVTPTAAYGENESVRIGGTYDDPNAACGAVNAFLGE